MLLTWVRRLGLLALVAVLPPGTTGAAERLVVGVEDSRYLPHYTFQEGRYGGFGRDLLDAYFAARAIQSEYRAMPVSRLFRDFLEGEIDLKYPDNPLWKPDLKAEAGVLYSDPVVAYIDGVSLPPEQVGSGADRIVVLGTLRGFTATSWIDRIESGQVRLVENDSFRGLVEQAIIGRIDGAYANVDVVRHLLSEELHRPYALLFDESLPHTRSHYHLSTISHPDVIADFNDWMKSEAGLIAKLKKRHGLQ